MSSDFGGRFGAGALEDRLICRACYPRWKVANNALVYESTSKSAILCFSIMFYRTAGLEVAALGDTYLRLWFAGARPGQGQIDVYLFLNDDGGQNEECFLFRVRPIGKGAMREMDVGGELF